MEEKIKVESGQLWKVVTNNFLTSKKEGKKTLNRQLKLDIGEVIEIRYPFAWHFRTIDGQYLHAEEETILENCEYLGAIWKNVKSDNKASTEEIYRLNLYTK